MAVKICIREFDALSAKCAFCKEKIGALKAQLASKTGRKRSWHSSGKAKIWLDLMNDCSRQQSNRLSLMSAQPETKRN